MKDETKGTKLKAIHRIEADAGRVIFPGESFFMEDVAEVERLLRLGAAELAGAPPAAADGGEGSDQASAPGGR